MVAGCLREADGRSVAELGRRRDEFLAELLGLVDRFSIAPVTGTEPGAAAVVEPGAAGGAPEAAAGVEPEAAGGEPGAGASAPREPLDATQREPDVVY